MATSNIVGGDESAVTFDKIACLRNLSAAWAFAKANNINLSRELTTLQEMQDQLRYHFMKQTGHMKHIKVTENLMKTIHDKDVERRSKLDVIYTDLRRILRLVMKDSRLRAQLETEEVTSCIDYKSTIRKFQESLRREHCPIVLAGETSSGKSSLLNLFIGKAVLPVKLLSCTSTACEISYGQQDGELVTRGQDGIEYRKRFPYDERERYIYKKADRLDVSKHTVRLWIPLPFLQSGVTLVDTPGIGEDPAMDKVLLDYVEQNDIYGFIYVIKSDNAGGVAKDRLQSLLVHLLTLNNEYGRKKVDPRTAIFVCNRWDMVPEGERAAVEQDIIEKLSMCWPGFDPKRQLFKMNTEFAFTSLTAGYITDDYAQLIDGIKRLLPMGLQRKLKMAHWWLENVLTRLYHPIRVYLHRSRQTKEEISRKSNMVNTQVSSIQKMCDNFVTEFSESWTSTCIDISEELLPFLKSPTAMNAMDMWNRDDLPAEEYGDSWPIIEQKIDKTIDDRIGSIIRYWERQHLHMETHQRKMMKFIDERTKSISDELDDLEKLIRSTSQTKDPTKSMIEAFTDLQQGSNDLSGEVELVDAFRGGHKVAEFFKDVNMLIAEKFGVISLHSNGHVHNLLEAFLVAPIVLMDLTRRAIKSPGCDKYNIYKQNKVKYVRDKAILVLENIQQLEVTRQLVELQLEDLHRLVKDVEHMTSTRLKANLDILVDITKNECNTNEVLETYPPLQAEVSKLLDQSAAFAYEAIRHNDIFGDVIEKTPGSKRSSARHGKAWGDLLDGLFAAYDAGKLKGDKHALVTIKSYHERMRDSDKQREENTIRSLMHTKLECIPILLMVVQSKDGRPSLVFQGELEQARKKYMSSSSQARRIGKDFHFRECNMLIESLCRALGWLHIKRLVHMEVSLDSVMVDAKGRVKLSNLGEARTLKLEENDADGAAGSYVYMPPEVMRGDQYTSASDVYSMGILVWEVWHDQQVFVEDRKDSIQAFRRIYDPFQAMMDTTSYHDTSRLIKSVVKKCMEPDVKARPNMYEFEKSWAQNVAEKL